MLRGAGSVGPGRHLYLSAEHTRAHTCVLCALLHDVCVCQCREYMFVKQLIC